MSNFGYKQPKVKLASEHISDTLYSFLRNNIHYDVVLENTLDMIEEADRRYIGNRATGRIIVTIDGEPARGTLMVAEA